VGGGRRAYSIAFLVTAESECVIWKMRSVQIGSVEIGECGNRGVWKMRSVRMRSVEDIKKVNILIIALKKIVYIINN